MLANSQPILRRLSTLQLFHVTIAISRISFDGVECS